MARPGANEFLQSVEILNVGLLIKPILIPLDFKVLFISLERDVYTDAHIAPPLPAISPPKRSDEPVLAVDPESSSLPIADKRTSNPVAEQTYPPISKTFPGVAFFFAMIKASLSCSVDN
jgi:hypothetical protein